MASLVSLLTMSLGLLSLSSLQLTKAFANHPTSFYRGRQFASLHGNSAAASTTTPTIEYDDLLPNPNPTIDPIEVVQLCMDVMMTKDNNEGLEVCFNFSSDYLRAPFQGSLQKFVEHANNPIFGALVKCTHYKIVNTGPMIEGTPNRGAMQTFLMDVESPGSEDRRYLWTLQKERRPPRSDCWLVHECLYVKNAFQLTT